MHTFIFSFIDSGVKKILNISYVLCMILGLRNINSEQNNKKSLPLWSLSLVRQDRPYKKGVATL